MSLACYVILRNAQIGSKPLILQLRKGGKKSNANQIHTIFDRIRLMKKLKNMKIFLTSPNKCKESKVWYPINCFPTFTMKSKSLKAETRH